MKKKNGFMDFTKENKKQRAIFMNFDKLFKTSLKTFLKEFLQFYDLY